MNKQSQFKKAFRLVVRSITLLIILALVSACAQTQENSVETSTSVPIQTFKPTNQLPTLQPSTSTPKTQQFTRLCESSIKVENRFSDVEGSWVYGGSNIQGIVARDISNGKEKKLKNVEGTIADFSLDGSAVADLHDGIIFISEDMEKTFAIEHLYLGGFLADGNILLGTRTNDNSHTIEGTTYNFFILSPDTGEMIPKSVFLPLLDKDVSSSYTQYSYDFKYISYPQHTSEGDKFAILSLQNNDIKILNVEIWGVPILKFGVSPVWRSDSRAITAIIVNSANQREFHNYYNISLDGQISQLTRFESVVQGYYQLLQDPSWSPNSRYLAMPIFLNNQEGSTVFILDTQTGEIMDTCSFWDHPFYFPLVWSPNSKYLVVHPWRDAKFQVVDVETQTIRELEIKESEHISLLGWVNWEIP